MYELIYTSAEHGLRRGTRGFCTVACTDGLTPNMVLLLEQLSAYRHLASPNSAENPVVRSHVIARQNGLTYHILSRVADAGLDYTNRSNKIAHHLILTEQETAMYPAGPAELLARDDLFYKRWDAEPKILPTNRRLPQNNVEPKICTHWKNIAGDAGWGGCLAASGEAGIPACLSVNLAQNLLPLFQESILLLPVFKRWNVSFTTFFTKYPPNIQCLWKGVLAGTPEEGFTRAIPNSLILNLAGSNSIPLPNDPNLSKLIEFARTGQKAVPVMKSRHQETMNEFFTEEEKDPSGDNFDAFMARTDLTADPALNSNSRTDLSPNFPFVIDRGFELKYTQRNKKKQFRQFLIYGSILLAILVLSSVIILMSVFKNDKPANKETDKKKATVQNVQKEENTSLNIKKDPEKEAEKPDEKVTLPSESTAPNNHPPKHSEPKDPLLANGNNTDEGKKTNEKVPNDTSSNIKKDPGKMPDNSGKEGSGQQSSGSTNSEDNKLKTFATPKNFADDRINTEENNGIKNENNNEELNSSALTNNEMSDKTVGISKKNQTGQQKQNQLKKGKTPDISSAEKLQSLNIKHELNLIDDPENNSNKNKDSKKDKVSFFSKDDKKILEDFKKNKLKIELTLSPIFKIKDCEFSLENSKDDNWRLCYQKSKEKGVLFEIDLEKNEITQKDSGVPAYRQLAMLSFIDLVLKDEKGNEIARNRQQFLPSANNNNNSKALDDIISFFKYLTNEGIKLLPPQSEEQSKLCELKIMNADAVGLVCDLTQYDLLSKKDNKEGFKIVNILKDWQKLHKDKDYQITIQTQHQIFFIKNFKNIEVY